MTQIDAEDRQRRVAKRDSNGFRLYRVTNRANGWLVSICFAGKRFYRYFGDRAYGSAADARDAAMTLASRNSALHLEFKALHARFHVRASSRSGKPGVTFAPKSATRRAGWLAYWDDPLTRQRRHKFFATERYGNENAFQLACAARDQAMAPFLRRYRELQLILTPESINATVIPPTEVPGSACNARAR
ncbi:AP2 domain-containing protein [Sphingomonas lenta]|uniref:AP2 domain-containing protein n=1 Tax=Sphingomonas lenta TaxID=1141887 RepID=UPI001140D9A8|nr:AP2 domain-containing protein [Sphingomonas lenta]